MGTVEADVDLRVGGRFRIVMRDRDTEIDHTGRYLVVEPPTRLVFTWVSAFTGPEPSLVTIDLEPQAQPKGAPVLAFVNKHYELYGRKFAGYEYLTECADAVRCREEIDAQSVECFEFLPALLRGLRLNSRRHHESIDRYRRN